MNQRSTFWLAAAGLFAAMLALGVGLVAVVRADDYSSTTAAVDGMGMAMSGSQSMMEHMAPAPMDGVPEASATRGGKPLPYTVANDVWVFNLEARSITLPSTGQRTLSFRARRGILIIDVGASRGSASYIARLG